MPLLPILAPAYRDLMALSGILVLFLSLITRDLIQALPFNVTEDGGQGFTVSIGSTVMLKHTRTSPILFVGKGRTAFPEVSGNFFITDYVSERLGLSDYVINCDSQACSLKLSRAGSFVELSLAPANGQPLALDIAKSSEDFDRIWFRLVAQPGEEVYGGGEQFSYFNLRHRDAKGENVFPIWTREQGVGRNKSTEVTFMADKLGGAGGDYHTTYFPQPSFVSSRKFSFHHSGANYVVLDFSQEDFHEVFILDTPGRIYLNARDSLLDLVKDMTSMLGRMVTPPDWVQGGAVLGLQGGTKVMLERYQYAKQHQIPVSGLWIQDWSGKQSTPFGTRVNWNWKWDPNWYPGLDQVIKNLTTEGVRVLGYINPNLDHRGDLFKEAASRDFLVKNSTGGIYYTTSLSFILGTVDFTNPQAYDWYKNDVLKKNMIDLGLGGWMADFGEYLPADAMMANGQTGQHVHNEWPRLWAQLNREALEETGKLGEIVFFMRAGFSGSSNASTLMWAGDQNVDFSYADGLHSAILGSLSMAMVGSGITHFDIGGYTTFGTQGLRRTEELLLRSAEVAAFTPVFRSHEGNQPQYNVQWYSSEAVVVPYSRLARIFAALKDYRKSVTQQVSSDGTPAQRPMQLHFPGLKAPYTQYMFGPDLLVCPVFLSTITTQDAVLPALDQGVTWVHVWSGKSYTGGQTVTVPAPLGDPPVFYKSDSKFKDTFEQLRGITELSTSGTDGEIIG